MTTLAANPVVTLRVADIDSSDLNPRKHFDSDKLAALGESLKSSTGQLEAILVRPHPTQPGRYELANGERRWRAAKLAGINQLAAKVREMTDAEVLDIMLAIGIADNVESLTPLEEANGYLKLKALRGFSDRELATHLGRPLLQVHRRLSLINLPAEAKTSLDKGELSPRTAWHIARIPGETIRAEAAKKILHSDIHGGVMPERAAAEFIESTICCTLKGAPFDTKDAALVPEAGPCTTCRFNADNNPEEYGDVGRKYKCMSPSCFEQKITAQRERVLAKEAQGGKIALTAEENKAAYPEGETGLAFNSEFVAYNQAPTADLLKKEVTKAPTWKELCAERGVQVYVGIHQDGYAVDLVKLGEAFAAVAEPTIFSEEAIKRYGLSVNAAIIKAAGKGSTPEEIAKHKNLPVEHVAAVLASHKPVADSQVAAEKTAEAARKRAEKAQKKKDKESRAWLEELQDALEKIPFAEGIQLWSLLYELHSAALTDSDIVFVLGMIGSADDVEKGKERAALEDYATGLSTPHLAALAVVLAVAPRVRAEGVDGALVKSWHEAIVNPPKPTEPEAVAFQGLPPEEAKRCTEIAKAHAGGMSVPKIAREFNATVAEVCGMLELDEAAELAVWEELRAALSVQLHRAGVSAKAFAPMIKLQIGRDVPSGDLVPEELTKLIEAMERIAATKTGKPVAP